MSHHLQDCVYSHPGYFLLHLQRNVRAQIVGYGLTLLNKNVGYIIMILIKLISLEQFVLPGKHRHGVK